MKNAIKVFCFVLVVLVATFTAGYVYFTWDVGEFTTTNGAQAGTVIISDYIGEETDVVIPSRLRGKKVVSVSDSAFKDSEITSVEIGKNVVSIGINAFQNCEKLTKVDMGKSVKSIGNGAFSNCPELTEVKFAPTVEKLGHVVFGNNKKLTTLDLNGNDNYKFVDGILYSADMTTMYESLVSADFSDFKLPETVVNLNSYAFYSQNELTSIELNDGIKKIDEGTFIDCKGLTELVIPDSVTSIGTVILSGSGVKTITIPDSVTKIDENAFLNVEKQITVITTKRSAAARLAEKKDIKLQIVDSL